MKLLQEYNDYKLYEEQINEQTTLIALSKIINTNININLKLNKNKQEILPNNCYIIINNININNITELVMKVYNYLKSEGITSFSPEIKIITTNQEELSQANKIKNQSNLRITITNTPQKEITPAQNEKPNEISPPTPNTIQNNIPPTPKEPLQDITNNIYYLDYNDYQLYDKNGTNLGKIGQNGYLIDYTTNTLKRANAKIGTIESYNKLSTPPKLNNKPKTRIKEKGIISLPIIILIISAIILIASIIIFLITK